MTIDKGQLLFFLVNQVKIIIYINFKSIAIKKNFYWFLVIWFDATDEIIFNNKNHIIIRTRLNKHLWKSICVSQYLIKTYHKISLMKHGVSLPNNVTRFNKYYYILLLDIKLNIFLNIHINSWLFVSVFFIMFVRKINKDKRRCDEDAWLFSSCCNKIKTYTCTHVHTSSIHEMQ